MSANQTLKLWARRLGRRACWMVLIALAVPVWAQDDGLTEMEKKFTVVIKRAKPAVVSIRVGPRRNERAFAPLQPEFNLEQPRFNLEQPEFSFAQPELAFELPDFTFEQPDFAFEQPQFNLEQPDFRFEPTPFMDGLAEDGIVLTAASAKASKKQTASAKATTTAKADASVTWGKNGDVMLMLQPTRVGSGFVVAPDGMILTTADVVGEGKEVQVRLGDGREMTGKVLGADRPTGLALVKVEATDLPVLRLAEGDGPEAGQWAIIIGNQLDRTHSVWVGTIARTDVSLPNVLPVEPGGRLLQINAPVGPGASGAPVLSSSGEVVGIVFASGNPWARFGQADPKEWEKFGEDIAAKFSKPNAELDRRVKNITKAAEEISKKAEARAAERQKRQEKESPQEKAKRERQEAELEAKLEKWGEELESKLEARGEKIEKISEQLGDKMEALAELKAEAHQGEDGEKPKPVDERKRRQLEGDIRRLQRELQREQQAMNRELSKINELLPQITGMREIAIDLQPEIARIVAEAQAISEAAIQPLLEPDPIPNPNPDAKPAEAPNPAAAPQPPDAPHPMPAPAAVAVVPGEARFLLGQGPGGGATTYAIPAATARWVVPQLREHGRVARPYLGIHLEELNPEERERLKAPAEASVRVREVNPDSPAQEAGLQKGDLILEFSGRKVENAGSLNEIMRRARVGERVSLVVWREGDRRTVQATLRERPPQRFLFNPPQPPRINIQPPAVVIPPRPPRVAVPRTRTFRNQPPTIVRVFPGRVMARADGRGRNARVTLEAQDAELEAVLGALSRATGLTFGAEENARDRRVTLKVEAIPVDDLVESLERLYRLRGERQGDRYTFRAR